MKSRLLECAIYLLLVSLAIAPASGIRVGGFILVTDVEPGDHVLHLMTADIGEAGQPVDVVAQLYGCGMNLDGSRVELEPDEDASPYSARVFLKVTPERVRVEPGTRAEFVLEGDVPVDVGSGGRYALVNIHTIPTADRESVGVSSAVQVPVFLTINESELIETGDITDVVVSEDGEGLLADVMFENTGNHHYRAGAEAVLKDDEGNVVVEASVPTSENSIIPTFSRLFTVKFNQEADLAPGTYTIEATVSLEDGTVLDTEEATFEV